MKNHHFAPDSSFIIIEASVDGAMDRAVDTIATNMQGQFLTLLDRADKSTDCMPLAVFLKNYRLEARQGWISTRRLRPGLNYDVRLALLFNASSKRPIWQNRSRPSSKSERPAAQR